MAIIYWVTQLCPRQFIIYCSRQISVILHFICNIFYDKKEIFSASKSSIKIYRASSTKRGDLPSLFVCYSQKVESAYTYTSAPADSLIVPLGGAGKLYGIAAVADSCPRI